MLQVSGWNMVVEECAQRFAAPLLFAAETLRVRPRAVGSGPGGGMASPADVPAAAVVKGPCDCTGVGAAGRCGTGAVGGCGADAKGRRGTGFAGRWGAAAAAVAAIGEVWANGRRSSGGAVVGAVVSAGNCLGGNSRRTPAASGVMTLLHNDMGHVYGRS